MKAGDHYREETPGLPALQAFEEPLLNEPCSYDLDPKKGNHKWSHLHIFF